MKQTLPEQAKMLWSAISYIRKPNAKNKFKAVELLELLRDRGHPSIQTKAIRELEKVTDEQRTREY